MTFLSKYSNRVYEIVIRTL